MTIALDTLGVETTEYNLDTIGLPEIRLPDKDDINKSGSVHVAKKFRRMRQN
jgi:hypothetical protein